MAKIPSDQYTDKLREAFKAGYRAGFANWEMLAEVKSLHEMKRLQLQLEQLMEKHAKTYAQS